MAATLTGLKAKVSLKIDLTTEKALDLSTPNDPLKLTYAKEFAFGAGAGQMNAAWSDSRTLAGGVAEDIDLAGALTDAYGDTITFANIKLLYIENTSAVGTDAPLLVGPGTHPWNPLFNDSTGNIVIKPGEGKLLVCRMDADGYAVTAGSGDDLQIDNDGAAAATYKIVIGGDSA